MTNAPWSVIVPQGNTELVDKFIKLAADMGLSEVRTETMLYMEFTAPPIQPKPLEWWQAKPLSFKVTAKIPCTVLNATKGTNAVITDGRLMDVIGRSPIDQLGVDRWCLQVFANPSLWVRPQDCEPL